MKLSDISVVGIGPGSQPDEDDGQQLTYLDLPKDMQVYQPAFLPEPELLAQLTAARDWLQDLQRAMTAVSAGQPSHSLDLGGLDSANRRCVDQLLGEGEVSIVLTGTPTLHIQEAVFAGVWRVQAHAADGTTLLDRVDIGPLPEALNHVFATAHTPVVPDFGTLPDGIINAPAVLVELMAHAARYQPGAEDHSINLSLLPQTPADLVYLDTVLGQGPALILSRGYGNCRISSTAIRPIWWVRYYNSNDTLILNTLEVAAVPTVACAAAEDLADSAARLAEILDAAL